MELEVLHTSGVPMSGILSIRAGTTRRQAQISSLDRPIKFPHWPEDCTTFKVDILALQATARLAYSPTEDIYSLPLEITEVLKPPDPRMEIAFAIRKSGTGGMGGKSVGNASMFDGTVMDNNGTVAGATDNGSKVDDPATQGWKTRKESAAKDYLDSHSLLSFMQFLLQSLMKDKPDDPYAFMQKQIAKKMQKVGPYKEGEHVEMPAPVPAPTPSPVQSVEAQGKDLEALLNRLASGPTGDVTEEQLAELEREALLTAERLRADNAKLRDTASHLRTQMSRMVGESERLHQRQRERLAQQSRARRASAETLAEKPIRQYYRDNFLKGCGREYWDGLCGRFAAGASRPLSAPLSRMQSTMQSSAHASAAPTPSNVSPSDDSAARRNTRQMSAFREIGRMQEEVTMLAKENEQLVKDLAQARNLMEQLGEEIRDMYGTVDSL